MGKWRKGSWKLIRLACGHEHRTRFSLRWPTYHCKTCDSPQQKRRKPYTFRSAYTHDRVRLGGRMAAARGQLRQGLTVPVKPEIG